MQLRVINPNTTAAVTENIGETARRVASAGTVITAVNPRSGPVSIEGHFDEAISVIGLLEEIQSGEKENADAFIIACFGDPGLSAARELTRAPVIGIAEAAFHVATLVSSHFSVVTTLQRTCVIAEHLLQTYGFAHRCRRVRAVDLPVLDLLNEDSIAFDRLFQECRRAMDEDNVGAIVLGCSAMSDCADKLRQALGIPVVDGVAAAVKLAESLVGLGMTTSKHGDLDFPRAKKFTGIFEYLSR